jgi:hypothetical protein
VTHAVIGYTGNVCSTPMVEYARGLPGVFVPVREEFDAYLLAKRFGEKTGPALARNLRALYARRSTPYLDQPMLLDRRGGGPLPGPDTAPHILFKWRPFAPDTEGAAEIRAVFEAHDVRPAVILRRSVAEQALKVYLSEQLHGSRHMQFKAAHMRPADYAAFRAETEARRVTIAPDEVGAIHAIARNFVNRTRQLFKAMAFFFPGSEPTPLILAEDIFSPLIDPARHSATLSRLLGASLPVPQAGEAPGIRKAGVGLDQCPNAAEVLAHPHLAAEEARYQAALQGRTILSSAA